MHLKSLEIKGFKSFADKVNIEFEKGITAIVGPNGSGKSNISDAIIWVLGEQSAKTLRGAKMEDIIFSGTQMRKGLGFAEVSLNIENAEQHLNIEYEDVKLTRRLYRSGESEYFINNTLCRLKDIVELFMDTGIGKDGYSIIGQGKIDEILSSRPEDRRNIFDEAAGITKYKTRKLEAEKKLDNTKQNIVRVTDITREIEDQLKPLEEQSKVAKKYLILNEELKELEVNNILRNYNNAKIKQENILNNINDLNEGKEEYSKNQKEIINKVNFLKEQIKIKDKEFEDLNNKKFINENKVEKLIGELNLNKERIINSSLEKDKLLIEVKIQENNIIEFKTKLGTLQSQYKLLIDEINFLKNDIGNSDNENININSSIDITEKSIEEFKSNLIEIIKTISEKSNNITTSNSNIKNYIAKIKQLEKEYDIKVNKINEIQEDINQLKLLYDKKEYEIEEITDLINVNINKLKLFQENLRESKSKREKQFSNLKIHEAKCKTLNDMEKNLDGYNKAVKIILANFNDKVHVFGTIGDIINVERKYEVAIEIAVGAAVQNIIVNDESTASKLINYLKQNNIGRATFLPLTTVKGYNNVLNLKLDGYLGIASNIVKFDNRFNNIVTNLLGRTIICDNLDNATKIAKAIKFSYRIVTLDGDIVNTGGSYTGGSHNAGSSGILSRKNEIGVLSELLVKEENELQKFDMNLKATSIEIDNTQNIIKQEEQSKQQLLFDVKDIENNIESRKKDITNFNQDIDSIKLEKDELISNINVSKNLIEKSNQDIDNLNSKQDILKKEISNKSDIYKSMKNKKEELWGKLTQSKISFAEKTKSLETVELSINEISEKDNGCKILIKNNKQNIITLESKINLLNKEVQENNQNKELVNIEIKEQTEQIKFLESKKYELNSTMELISKELENINESITNVLDSLHKLEINKSKSELEIENYVNKLWEQYELTIPQTMKYKKDILNVNEMLRNINSLKEEIKTLGNVNINAVEEFEKMSERYNFLNIQKLDLERAEISLSEIIDDIDKKMKEQFVEKFKIVREYYDMTFKELFNGGYADLRLDFDDALNSGIEIICQPPGKKLQNLSLLSGGEKGLAAIALIFAILKLKPTPFCVLDEIEAAQDDANVNRFANYLKKYTDNTQFIVITHRKGTMAVCDTLYGVTMEEKGVSKIISLKMNGGKNDGVA